MNLRASDRQSSNIVLGCVVDGRDERALLCDISPTGCRVEFYNSFPPPRGTTLVFEVRDPLYFAGEVVWIRGSEAGVRLSRPLTPELREALEL